MDSLLKDFRIAFRSFLKRPGFVAVAVFTLALGIGANTAIFSVVDAVLLKGLPYPDADRLVEIREVNDIGRKINLAEPNFNDLREQSRGFESLAEYGGGSVIVTGGAEPARAMTFYVTGDFFRTVGVQPYLGRFFLPEESRFGGQPVAVVSHGFWQRMLGGRTDFTGVKLDVDGVVCPVVGVMPPGLGFPQQCEVWVPREIDGPQKSRTAHNFKAIGRLKAGTSAAQAQAEATTIARQLRAQYGQGTDAADFAVVPAKDLMTGQVREGLLIIAAAVTFLLLIACANVTNLLLARLGSQATEIAVRTALGATRLRLARQYVVENLILTLMAAAGGLAMSWWGVDVLRYLNQGNLPRGEDIALNFRTFAFTLGLSVFVAVVLSIIPAIQASGADLVTRLKQAGNTAGASRQRNRSRTVLVTTQVALTLTLLVGAGLLIRGFAKLIEIDPGFRPERAFAMTLSLPSSLDKSQEPRLLNFHRQLLERVSGLPNVASAGGISDLPMSNGGANGRFLKDNNPALQGDANYRLASAGYFPAMGIPLLRGRLFNATDSENAPPAAVISQSLAKRYWPDEDPIGRTIQFGNMDGDTRPMTIVGVVGDIREDGLDQPVGETIYGHSMQRPQWWQVSNLSIVVRTTSAPNALIPAMRDIVRSLDPNVPLKFKTVSEIYSSSLDTRRFSLVIFAAFSVVALLLAMTGVYGVVSYLVTQRRREIGIRLALGANREAILGLVIRQGMRPTIFGISLGLISSYLLARAMRSLLFGVSPTDPITFGAVAGLLAAVALLACWLPARRASKEDPLVALRHE